MFYESSRIVNKNQKYVKTMAYNAINKALSLGISYEEIIVMNEIALKDSSLSEIQVEILNKIHSLSQASVELSKNEENMPNYVTNIDELHETRA